MSLLVRYQKPGGYTQLLALLEGFGQEKRKKFLELIREESPAWADSIEGHVLSLPKIMKWDPDSQREVFSRLKSLTLATALHGLEPADRDKITSCLTASQKREVRDHFEASKPTPAEVATIFMKIIAEVRAMEEQGTIRFEKVDPSLTIPDKIEEKLGKGQASPLKDLEPSPEALKELKEQTANVAGPSAFDHEKLKQTVAILQKEILNLRQENAGYRARLEKIQELTVGLPALKKAS